MLTNDGFQAAVIGLLFVVLAKLYEGEGWIEYVLAFSAFVCLLPFVLRLVSSFLGFVSRKLGSDS